MNTSAHTVATPATAADPTAEDGASRSLPAWAAPAALGAILVLAAVLYAWSLSSLGWGNSYYSAAVKSMGQNWTNFLFGSFDPAGVVTVDKPPAALWPQVISSKIFGLHGWTLVLPQTIEGVAAVFVLHRTVRRWAGERAALLAALVLTVTPITVAIDRDNNPDSLLVLLLVSAAYALTRALRAEGRAATYWLCACGFLIGCGFLTKMLAAWMVLPAFAAAWLIGAAGTWAARLWRLAAATGVLLVSSMWWVAMVALWPGDHPYIGGSEDGSAWNLIIGYNGFGRIFGSSGDTSQGFGGAFGGEAGAGRLFNDQVAGQISWLLPACGVLLAVAVASEVLRRRGRLSATDLLPLSGWVLWGGWLVVCAAVYSTQEGIFHPYYTTQLAPAVAALCGGGFVLLARLHRTGVRWAPVAGAAAVAATVIWAAVVIRRDPDWNGWLVWPVLLAGCAAVVLLFLVRQRGRLVPATALAAVLAVLLAPGAWAVSESGSKDQGMGGTNPTAGPMTSMFGGRGMPGPGAAGGAGGPGMPSGMPSGMPGLPGGGTGAGSGSGMPSGRPSGMPAGGSAGSGASAGQGMPSFPGGSGGNEGGMAGRMGGMGGGMGGAQLTGEQRKILAYAVKNAPNARIKLAVASGATAAAAFILNSDETVIGMGGFTGMDNVPSTDQLAKWTTNGELRYVLGTDSGAGGTTGGPRGASGAGQQRTQWIAKNCTKVPASAYGGSSGTSTSGTAGFGGATVLYDCAADRH
ncbi:glycosyltransferase family 39 protein [Streptomyces sp. NPDC001980]|uniref:ArnT family glycosyltransferase n=1 Tax=Streptomyces sp. NPDC001980 TaxID=3157126 RepID=UPI003321D86D